MSSIKDFSGIDFDLALGEVYGLRTWRMDAKGRLRSLHLEGVPAWRPGINEATCQVNKSDPYGLGIYISSVYSFSRAVLTPPEKPKTEGKPPEHLPPVESCRCGFYAYTDPRHEELLTKTEMPQVLGVIRGTGRTLIGTKGFRCEKAEIVAILDPARGLLVADRERRRRRAYLRDLYGVPLLRSRSDLFEAFPIERAQPGPDDDAFWTAP